MVLSRFSPSTNFRRIERIKHEHYVDNNRHALAYRNFNVRLLLAVRRKRTDANDNSQNLCNRAVNSPNSGSQRPGNAGKSRLSPNKSQQQKRLHWILWEKIQFKTLTCTFFGILYSESLKTCSRFFSHILSAHEIILLLHLLLYWDTNGILLKRFSFTRKERQEWFSEIKKIVYVRMLYVF